MKIIKSRIRSPKKYLKLAGAGERFYVATRVNEVSTLAISNAGFGKDVSFGDIAMPNAIGKITTFNQNGGIKVRRDLPKEKAKRPGVVTDWHHNTHNVIINYVRYPRETIPAPNIKLEAASASDTSLIIISPSLMNDASQYDTIRHVINLFLEVFGECEILDSEFNPFLGRNTKRLEWTILPKGTLTLDTIISKNPGLIERLTPEEQGLIKERFEEIQKYKQDFNAIGRDGFSGYVVFGFEAKNLYLLESIFTGNATYVFGENWEELSKLSKSEILNNDLLEKRIVHSETWKKRIKSLLN